MSVINIIIIHNEGKELSSVSKLTFDCCETWMFSSSVTVSESSIRAVGSEFGKWRSSTYQIKTLNNAKILYNCTTMRGGRKLSVCQALPHTTKHNYCDCQLIGMIRDCYRNQDGVG